MPAPRCHYPARVKSTPLLQAIARVNRIHEDKEFGYLSIRGSAWGVDQSVTMYAHSRGLRGRSDGHVESVHAEWRNCPKRYSDLWDLFQGSQEQLWTKWIMKCGWQ
jgi:type I restriction enzyme R subunit